MKQRDVITKDSITRHICFSQYNDAYVYDESYQSFINNFVEIARKPNIQLNKK